jgi:peptidoglycan/LPS O-acetylase OafA/YrhL
MTADSSQRIEPLDGLRGIAALWVFAGHALVLSGAWVPILGRPLLAVDLFMMLSGALMVYQAGVREPREPMAAPNTWLRFWTRRFFRIAPVFYLAFLVAIALGPWMGEMREVVSAANGKTADWQRYNDQSWANILMHLSYVFAVVPAYAARSPLPDWSIGLEMQFYLAFPFILLLLRRTGFVIGAVVLTAAAATPWLFAGDWLLSFERPSFLLLKLNMFLAGMLVMRARDLAGLPRAGLIAVAIALAMIPLDPIGHWSEIVVRALSVLLIAVSIIPGVLALGPLEAIAGWGRGLLSWSWARRMGDVSYGVYLIHLIVLVPVVALTTQHLGGLPPLVRALIAFAGSAALVYPLGWVLYRWLEEPGIALGRAAVSRIGPRSPSRPPA